MVAHGRVELLAHPLSQKYLQMKWNSYGKYFHVANLLFYCIFLSIVTLYTYLLMDSVPNTVLLSNSTSACTSWISDFKNYVNNISGQDNLSSKSADGKDEILNY